MIYAVNKRTKEHRIISGNTGCRAEYWYYVQADPDGWIEWHGGECPLPYDVKCEVKLRDGWTSESRAGDFSPRRWMDPCFAFGEGIIAYRPILDSDTKPEEARGVKTKVWFSIATEDGRAPHPPEFYVNAGDKVEVYVVPRSGKPKPPAWDGEGNPPVGTPVKVRTKECDSAAVVLANDHNIVVVRYESALGFKYGGFDRLDVRPIRSEEDRAVEAIAEALEWEFDSHCRKRVSRVYNAIRDGKVPGVKLTGGEG